jgi:hypothetical protein
VLRTTLWSWAGMIAPRQGPIRGQLNPVHCWPHTRLSPQASKLRDLRPGHVVDILTVDAGWLVGTVTEVTMGPRGHPVVAVDVGGDTVYDVDTRRLQCLAAPGTHTGSAPGRTGLVECVGSGRLGEEEVAAPSIPWQEVGPGCDVDVLVWRQSRWGL